MSQPKISIILPALNEEETIGKVIDEIPISDTKNLLTRMAAMLYYLLQYELIINMVIPVQGKK